jgi:Putative ABC-transporter type IV
MTGATDLLIFLVVFVGGVFLEIAVVRLHHAHIKTHHKEHHFSFAKYLLLILFPLIACGIILVKEGGDLVSIFIAFSVLGTALEWFVAFGYHQIMGQRLWTYHRYSITKYTSFLSIPFWGTAGILAWLIIGLFRPL